MNNRVSTAVKSHHLLRFLWSRLGPKPRVTSPSSNGGRDKGGGVGKRTMTRLSRQAPNWRLSYIRFSPVEHNCWFGVNPLQIMKEANFKRKSMQKCEPIIKRDENFKEINTSKNCRSNRNNKRRQFCYGFMRELPWLCQSTNMSDTSILWSLEKTVTRSNKTVNQHSFALH